MKLKSILLLALFISTAGLVRAQEATNDIPPQIAKLLNGLKYQSGEIDLGGGLAKLTVPKEFKFLGSDDAVTVLVKLWGNPPSETKPLGLLIPAGLTPISSNVWIVTIDYSEDGFVKDDDAAKINYDDLLKKMQSGIAENNKTRKENGYPTIALVGWAAPPHYDSATHKLYWAKDLKFEGEEHNTLNYSIRMLGRKGVLELNAIAGVEQFAEIDKQTPEILAMVDFKEGSRYTDFDSKTDKVAEYGIATLVAGGALAAAAKLGLFKGLWIGLLAAKKFIIIGVIAVIAAFKKFFKRGDNSSGGAT
ncbi:MAG: putative rane protein [Verrucomicrobiota bacterium]